MTTDMLDEEAVEAFLNEHQDFLGTFLAKQSKSKKVIPKIVVTRPTLTMSKCVEKLINHHRAQKQKVIDTTINENQRFSEFIKDIAGELNVNALSHKILQNVINLTESERGRLFLVEGTDEKYLISRLHDVTATSTLDDTILNESMALHIPFGKGIVGKVAETRMAMNIKNTQSDPRFDSDIDGLPGYKIRCMLCMPIMNKEGDVVGVAEIMNKISVDNFSEKDEILFTEYLGFCGIGINNARLFQMSVKEVRKNQLLLSLAWQISIGQSSIDKLTQSILEHAVQLVDCKFAKLYLLDAKGKSFSKFYRLNQSMRDMIIAKDEPEDAYNVLAKECLDSNRVIDLIDLESQLGFVSADKIPPGDTDVDKKKIYEEDANWTLFAAIRDPSNNRIGCIMFAGQTTFIQNDSDISSVEAFAIYCGLGVYNCQLYEKTTKSLTAKEITMEILSYHLISEKAEVNRFINLQMPSLDECNIYDIEFNDVMINDVSTVQVVAQMFMKLNALDILGISPENLFHWILTVKKNYKPLLYHNWRHALNVSQMMFCALSNGSLKNFFSPFECICLLVATLCHDLDYQGFASAKKLKSTSLLATVYSTSSDENQILGRCVMILNAESTNIFRNLMTEKYREAMEFIKRAILSTDIYDYILNVDYLKELKQKKRNLYNAHDKEMIMSLAMISCDLIAFSKEWGRHKSLVLTDVLDLLQPQESGPAWLNKSEVNKIPKMMVDFIDVICLKVFETMAHFDDIFTQLYKACSKNRQIWEYMVENAEEFNVENEVMKSRAGLTDFDEDVSQYIDKSAREKKNKEKKAKKEKEEREQKEKGQRELEEREKKAREEKEKNEMENREAEEKKKKEEKEKAEKERREKEEKERNGQEEKEKEQKERDEMEQKKKEAEAKEAEAARKKKEDEMKKIQRKKSEERPPSPAQDESRSTITPSPTVSPKAKPRRSSKGSKSQLESVGRKLSSQKSSDKPEEMTQRRSEKKTRKSSIVTPADKSSAKAASRRQSAQRKSIPLDTTKAENMHVEPLDGEAKMMPKTTKRKCAPKATDKVAIKSTEKSKLCAIM